MKSTLRSAVLSIIAVTLPTLAFGATYVVPTDEELIRSADVIVYGRVASTQSLLLADGTIVTDATIEPSAVLKGERSDRFIVRDPGGVVGSLAMGVSGWEPYHSGSNVVVFMERHRGHLRTFGIGLGKFVQVRSAGGVEVLRRGGSANEIFGWSVNGERHVERPRRAAEFLDFIRRVVAGSPRARIVSSGAMLYDATDPVSLESTSTALVPATDAHYPPSAYTQGTFRWDRFDAGQSVSFRVSGSQPGYDSTGAAQRGLAAWTNEPNSNVVYLYGGTTTAGFVQDGVNAVVFNSSSDVPSGAIGYARWWANAEHTYKGERFWSTSEGDAVMRSNLSISQKAFDEAVTHELGHTLGFRHSNERAPASSAAVMNSVVTGNYGATLGPWDVEAVTHVYTGAGSTPPPPPPPASGVRGDFNGDGLPDIVLRNYSTGQNAVWLMNGTSLAGVVDLPALPNTNYRFEGTGDFNGDGRTDIVLRNYSTGQNAVWLMNGTTLLSITDLPSLTNLAFTIAGTSDFNRDGKSDILLRNQTTGTGAIWIMDGTRLAGIVDLPVLANTAYRFEGAADFNLDGHADIVLRNYSTGQNAVWLMSGVNVVGIADLPALPNTAYRFEALGDYNRDGRTDIVLRNYSTGQNAVWILNGFSLAGVIDLPQLANLSYEIAGPR